MSKFVSSHTLQSIQPSVGSNVLRKRSQVLLKDKLELVKFKYDGKTRYTIKPLEFELGFDKGFFVSVRAPIRNRAVFCWCAASHNICNIVFISLTGIYSSCTAANTAQQRCHSCKFWVLLLRIIHTTGNCFSAPSKLQPNMPTFIVQVGLAGPSGSGKTAFSEKIQNFIPGCTLLSMDNYNDGSKVIDGNFDGQYSECCKFWIACIQACPQYPYISFCFPADPRITDYDTLLCNIKDLKEGRATQVSLFCCTSVFSKTGWLECRTAFFSWPCWAETPVFPFSSGSNLWLQREPPCWNEESRSPRVTCRDLGGDLCS